MSELSLGDRGERREKKNKNMNSKGRSLERTRQSSPHTGPPTDSTKSTEARPDAGAAAHAKRGSGAGAGATAAFECSSLPSQGYKHVSS